MTSAVEALSLEQCPECEGTGGHGDWIENQPVCPTCGGTGARVPGLRRECGYITMYYTISRGQIWSTRLLPPSGFPDGISPKCRTIDRAATPHIRTAKWASECKGGCGGRGWVLIPSAEVMGVLVRAAPKQMLIGPGCDAESDWFAELQMGKGIVNIDEL